MRPYFTSTPLHLHTVRCSVAAQDDAACRNLRDQTVIRKLVADKNSFCLTIDEQFRAVVAGASRNTLHGDCGRCHFTSGRFSSKSFLMTSEPVRPDVRWGRRCGSKGAGRNVAENEDKADFASRSPRIFSSSAKCFSTSISASILATAIFAALRSSNDGLSAEKEKFLIVSLTESGNFGFHGIQPLFFTMRG